MSRPLERSHDGTLRIEGSEARVIILPANALAKLYEELKKVLGVGAHVMLRKVGESFGESIIEIAKKEGKTEEGLAALLEKTGFGKVEIEKEGDSFLVKIYKAPSLDVSTECCSFEEGIVKAVLEGVEGGKWRVKTVKTDPEVCIIKGTRVS